MKAEIRKLISPDLLNLESDTPSNIEHFCLLVQALIGPSDGAGEESFDFLICTPSWLESELTDNDFLFGRHYLLIKQYDYSLIHSAIDSLCSGIDGATWHELGAKLSRYGKWEFEDYRP